MTKDEIKINREFLVCKSNKLIQHSAFDLSPQQQKLILFAISKIKPDDEKFKEYEFNLEDFCDVLGIQKKQSKNIEDLKAHIKNLHDKSFWIEDNNEKILCSWINKARINPDEKTVVIRLDDDLKPYLLQLKENYTTYELINVLALDSKYSIRLYEILKSYSNLGELTIELETLKKMLNCQNKYKNIKDFKLWAIEPALKELNKFTNITVTVDYKREGRFIKYIHFTITEKKYGMDKINMKLERERKLENE